MQEESCTGDTCVKSMQRFFQPLDFNDFHGELKL